MMKMVFFAIALATSISYARMAPMGGTQSKMPAPVVRAEDSGFSSKGIRVALVKPPLEVESKASNREMSRTSKGSFDDGYGLSVGYTYLPIRTLGFTTNLSLLEYKTYDISAQITLVDANLAYAFNKNLNVKGGLNLGKFTNPADAKDEANPQFGGQLSGGFQVTRYVGVDLSYIRMNQKFERGDRKVEFMLSGLEIALHGTF